MRTLLVLFCSAILLSFTLSGEVKAKLYNKTLLLYFFTLSDYSRPVYDTTKVSVEVKLVQVMDGQPKVSWEFNIYNDTLSKVPHKDKAITQKLPLRGIRKETYLVYQVDYEDKGAVMKRQAAVALSGTDAIVEIEI